MPSTPVQPPTYSDTIDYDSLTASLDSFFHDIGDWWDFASFSNDVNTDLTATANPYGTDLSGGIVNDNVGAGNNCW